ncbi:MAG: methyltransferase [Myxococcales bacterium]|nr:methyltransferase [Myxococcales bacterium]
MLPDRLWQLGRYLETHHALWHDRAFVQRPVSWEAAEPALVAWLDAQPTALFLAPDRAWLAEAPPVARRWAAEADALAALPALSAAPTPLRGFGTLGLPGRKLSQIEHFAAPVRDRWPRPTRITDWCAGKGHLGRALCHHTGAALQALEWQEALCAAGRVECERVGVAAHFACVDVRDAAAAALLAPDDLVVALHACGGLHTALLRAVVERGAAGLALAPCCYNQPSPDRGRPLSRAAAAVGLRIDDNDLDLLHRQPANASQGTLRRSRQNQHWRLAFDALQRQATGVDAYRPMPPFPDPWLALPFDAFCARFAELEGIELPAHLRPDDFLAEGEAAWRATVARDAVRSLFARPLEAWLVLDRACYLEEAGYAVEVGTFCDRTLTPRNAIILARQPTTP